MAILRTARQRADARSTPNARSPLARALGRGVAALGITLLGSGLGFAAVATGDPAPEIELPDLDGRTTRLSTSRGRIVLVDFWASWCAPCAAEMTCLHELRARYPADVQLLSISIDRDADLARRFVAAKLPAGDFAVLHDASGEVLAEWGAEGMPALYLIDREGTVRDARSGAGGCKAIEPTLREVLGSPPAVEPSPTVP